MKRVLACLIAVSVAGLNGCLHHHQLPQERAVQEATTSSKPRVPQPPVTPEQVNTDNARERAQALLDEIDQEQSKRTVTVAPK